MLWAAVGVHAQSERSLIRDGNRSYKENNFTDAEVKYKKALEKNKDLPQGLFNLGDALYKQGRFDEAANQFLRASSKNDDAAAKSGMYHNLGNALLKEKKLPESIASYKEALKLRPNDLDTKYNLEYAKALLKQQQQNKNQQKESKQDKQKDKQNQDKQDQQKQDQKKEEQQNKEEQRQAQQKKQQISKEDAERILEALKNEEKDVQKKLHKKVPARVRVEKDW